MLKVENLAKTFVTRRDLLGRAQDSVRAVKGISFKIEPGETVSLVGESGSGKSTTGRLILRLIEPDSGRVFFNGKDIRTLDKAGLRLLRRKMQMIFQDPYGSFDPRVSVGHSIAEPLIVHFGMGRTERMGKAASMLERVGMSAHDLDRLPRELSGGQLQRCAIARALTLEPALLVCDECVSALDVSIRAQVLNLLEDLRKDTGTAYLFITHDLSVVKAIAARVYVMSAGEIVESGRVSQIFESPRHPYTQQLLSAIPRFIA
jgi:peptide/nickel transport system ATP-binding protein